MAAQGTMAMVHSLVPTLVRIWRAGGGSVHQRLRCDEAPGRVSICGGTGHIVAL
jgi:hypothetical protein